MFAGTTALERWSRSHREVAEWLETALQDGHACFALPESHRRRIRTANGLERFIKSSSAAGGWGGSSRTRSVDDVRMMQQAIDGGLTGSGDHQVNRSRHTTTLVRMSHDAMANVYARHRTIEGRTAQESGLTLKRRS